MLNAPQLWAVNLLPLNSQVINFWGDNHGRWGTGRVGRWGAGRSRQTLSVTRGSEPEGDSDSDTPDP